MKKKKTKLTVNQQSFLDKVPMELTEVYKIDRFISSNTITSLIKRELIFWTGSPSMPYTSGKVKRRKQNRSYHE